MLPDPLQLYAFELICSVMNQKTSSSNLPFPFSANAAEIQPPKLSLLNDYFCKGSETYRIAPSLMFSKFIFLNLSFL